MEEERKVIELTEEEKENMRAILTLIEKQKAALGVLRRQYLNSESKLLEALDKGESDYISHVNMLSKMKKVPTSEEKWAFDPTACVFRKIEDNQ